MDQSIDDELLRQLPTVHAVALRLQRAGQPAAIIAVALGFDVADVRGLLELGERKLAALATAREEATQSATGGHAE